jgi:hypothetical protein
MTSGRATGRAVIALTRHHGWPLQSLGPDQPKNHQEEHAQADNQQEEEPKGRPFGWSGCTAFRRRSRIKFPTAVFADDGGVLDLLRTKRTSLHIHSSSRSAFLKFGRFSSV